MITCSVCGRAAAPRSYCACGTTFNAGAPKAPNTVLESRTDVATSIVEPRANTIDVEDRGIALNHASQVGSAFEEASASVIDALLAKLRNRGALKARPSPELECALCEQLYYDAKELLKHVRRMHERDADAGWDAELHRVRRIARAEQSAEFRIRGDMPGTLIGDADEFTIHYGSRALATNLNRMRKGAFPAIQIEAPGLGDFVIAWSNSERHYLILQDPPLSESSFFEDVAERCRATPYDTCAPLSLAFTETAHVSRYVSVLLEELSGEQELAVGLGRVSWCVPWDIDLGDVREHDMELDDGHQDEDDE